jgi:hypothetical protein
MDDFVLCSRFLPNLMRLTCGYVAIITARPISPQKQGTSCGIRTHGTVTRTTVFEFEDSRAGACRPISNRVL